MNITRYFVTFMTMLIMSGNASSASTIIAQFPVVDFYLEKMGGVNTGYWQKFDTDVLLVEDFSDLDAFAYINFDIPQGLAAGTHLLLDIEIYSQNLKQPDQAILNVYYIANDDFIKNHPDIIHQNDLLLGDLLITSVKYTDFTGVFDLGILGDQERLYDHSLSLLLTMEGSSKRLLYKSPPTLIITPIPEPSSLIMGSLIFFIGLLRRLWNRC